MFELGLQSPMRLEDSLLQSLADGIDPAPTNFDFEDDPEEWLQRMFPKYVNRPFADHHRRYLDWLWSIELGKKPPPYILILARGGGKSTLAELSAVALGARNRRRYIVYVRRTQDKADESVANVATMLESSAIDLYYPSMGQRSIGKFGSPKDWRRQRLRTASGFTLDALGAESPIRSAKANERRPDMFIFDDVDDLFDSPKVVQKYIDVITKSILPAGDGRSLAVLGIQNLIRSDGFFGRMADGSADYLANRIVDGPVPALYEFEYEQRKAETGELKWFITHGIPSWPEGQGLDTCQDQIWDWGLTSFRQEAQHEVDLVKGGMYDDLEFQHIEMEKVPPLTAVEVWLDPAITSGISSNCQGLQCDGIDAKRNLYRLYSWEGILSPEGAIKKAILIGLRFNARAVGVETDQGGDVWATTYNNTFKNMIEKGEIPPDARRMAFKAAKAGSIGGKIERQNMQRVDYDSGHIYHVIGTHETLEKALRRFPLLEPFDLADASFWSWRALRHKGAWTR